MNKKLIITTLALLLFYSPALAFAQSSTDSASQIRDAVQKKVAEELSNIKQAVARRAYVGTIASKSEATVTITNLKNQTRTATVTANTIIKLTGGKDGTPEDLKVGNFIIVMGDVDSQNTMTAKRLIVVSKPDVDKRRVLFGTVTKTTSSSLTIEDSKKETWTVKTSSKAKVGDKIIAIGTPVSSSNNTLTAKLVHLIPALPAGGPGLSKPTPIP